MPRVLCVWFPNWPIQRLRGDRPELRRSNLVVFAGQNQRPFVTNLSDTAARAGLLVGQPLAEAKAQLPRAVYLPADPGGDRAALCQLAVDFQCFSPLVGLEESEQPETLVSEITGCTHLWHGEERFLDAVRSYWRGRGLVAQLAVAATLGTAWALAHTRKLTLVPAGDEAKTLSGLPVTALRLPPEVSERLEALGLYLIGDVLSIPRETLASRFGTILPRRLDQALGRLTETFVCERLREPLTAVREWEMPVEDRFAVDRVCRDLIRELLALARGHGLGLQELDGEIRTETGTVPLEIRLVEPTSDDTHLAQLAMLQLERQTWSGGVVAVRWSAPRLGKLEQAQGRWFDDEVASKTSRAFNTLVERLASRLEPGGVLRIELVADAQPEHAVRLVPWTDPRPPVTDTDKTDQERCRGRPLRLLDRPVCAHVTSIVPDGPPIRMVWNRHDYRVVRAWGPERIATGWWRAHDVERDYYRVEWDDGTHAWVFRDQRHGRWYLHGFFD